MYHDKDNDELRFALGVMQQRFDWLDSEIARLQGEQLRLKASIYSHEEELERRSSDEQQLEIPLTRRQVG